MQFEIDDLDDPRLAPYRQLKRSNLTRWSGLFVAEGPKLTRRLLESDLEAASVLLGRSHVRAFEALLKPQTPAYVVPDELVERIVGFNFHRGVLACGRRRPARGIDEVAGGRDDATIVVCPDVQDPENMGAILRISAAFGVAAVVLGGRCADPFSRRALRVSMGAALRLPLVESVDLIGDLKRLRDHWSYQLIATILDAAAQPLARTGRGGRVALLFGSEGHGLERAMIELCDRTVTIPMKPGTDSLNVAVAAGIFLHHFSVQPVVSAPEA